MIYMSFICTAPTCPRACRQQHLMLLAQAYACMPNQDAITPASTGNPRLRLANVNVADQSMLSICLTQPMQFSFHKAPR